MKMTGTIEAVRRDNKGFKIGDDWYSVYNPSQLNGCVAGDNVSFDFVEKGTFKNVKGGVTKGAGGTTSPAAETPFQELPPHYFVSRGYANLEKKFPLPPTHPDRCIVRQNALTNAVKFMENVGGSSTDKVIAVAKEFEAYAAGDHIRMEAEKRISEMDAED